MEKNVTKIEQYLDRLIDVVVVSLPSIFAAIVILFLGRFAIKFLIQFMNRRFEKRNVDKSIRGFAVSLVKFVLYALLLLTVASTMGIQTTSFIAALSAFGLAVGMALQGSLSNFAGGVLILMFRPFEVGDYISSANGSNGTVERIDLLYTTMIDDSGIRVFSPNGSLANSVIKNYTKILSRRFEFVIGISYDDNIKVAKDTILAVLQNETEVLKTPAPDVFAGDLADSSVNLTVRGWVKRENFWATTNGLREKIKVALDEKGISIPYPQTEMHIKSDGQILGKLPNKS
ncbi:small conductance mechanosensitive channel [Sphingobacterium nematocida]|uniref:Small conductance mechanosensitive channel n=1 Tax=Sphingobacterium nematocida TaxID=1513896 RepID=A0A1T5C5D5_9SPHI|nr:mechanosensitive ion channel family protein [Sphingobacterium nematocida]SKB54370.1 small conductance mechanosensitive channel [Sphingobacterium nematocida]